MSRDLSGKVVGGYRLGEVASWGKWPGSTVYEGEQAASGTKVLVKVYGADFSKDKNVAARLVAEVQRATQVKHPMLHEVLDVGTTEHKGKRFLYVVGESLRGEPLASRLAARKGPLPLALCLQVVSDVGAALQAVHRQGGAHRTLSPNSVFLCQGDDGEVAVKLMDLGAAQVQGAEREKDAKEEKGAKDEDPVQEDIRALARLAQEMLSKPEAGPAALKGGPLRHHNPDVPAHVDGAVRLALGELGREGFASVGSFVGAMLAMDFPPTIGPWSSDGLSMPPAGRSGPGLLWVVGGLAAAGGLGLWLYYREPAGSTPTVDLAPQPAALDQAASAPAADLATGAPSDLASAAAPDLATAPDLARPAPAKKWPKRTGPPIPPVRGASDFNPNLVFGAAPAAEPAAPAAEPAAPPAEPAAPAAEPAPKPAAPKKYPKRTGPPIPPLRS